MIAMHHRAAGHKLAHQAARKGLAGVLRCHFAKLLTASSDSALEVQEFNETLREVFGVEGRDETPLASSSGPDSALTPGLEASSPQTTAAQLSHVDNRGEAAMVNTGSKPISQRVARAEGCVRLGRQAFEAVRQNAVAKGDVLAVARIAGIMAAKQTSQLIPLCHSLSLDRVAVDFRLRQGDSSLEIAAEAQCSGRTGVEMEAMTAVSVAALTVYDMCKAVSKEIEIDNVRLVHKSGGKSGPWQRGEAQEQP